MGKAKHGGRGESRRTRMVKRERRGGRKDDKKNRNEILKRQTTRDEKEEKKNPNVDIERIKKRRGRRRGKEEGKPNLKRSFGCHRPERRRRMLMEEESSGNGERAAKGLTFFPHFLSSKVTTLSPCPRACRSHVRSLALVHLFALLFSSLGANLLFFGLLYLSLSSCLC